MYFIHAYKPTMSKTGRLAVGKKIKKKIIQPARLASTMNTLYGLVVLSRPSSLAFSPSIFLSVCLPVCLPPDLIISHQTGKRKKRTFRDQPLAMQRQVTS